MVPDERRGKLRLCKDTDGLTHLQWGVRAPDMPFTPEEDLLVFPHEAEMKFIPKPGVFVIKFPDDPARNMFFWIAKPMMVHDGATTMSYSSSKSFVCQFALKTPPIAMCVVPCGAYMILEPKSENLESWSCS